MKKKMYSRGFTLVELLVTLAMTAILTASVYGIFGVQAQRKAVEQKSIEMQQNARVAIDAIARDMRMAGFWGCMTPGNFKNTVSGYEDDILLQMNPVIGENNLDDDNPYGAKLNTDLLVLSYADGNGAVPVAAPYMPNQAAALHVADPGSLRQGDIALVSDCSFTTVFQITQINDNGNPSNRDYTIVHNQSQGQGTPNPGNWDQSLGYSYGAGSHLYPMGAKYYWVNSQDQLMSSMGGFNTVTNSFEANFNEQIIAENVEDLQLEYGMDSNGDGRPDQWEAANAVSNWSNVIAVRIFLLAKSAKMEKDYNNAHVYAFADRPSQQYSYNDRYHRLLLQRAVTLRNRTM